MIITSSSDGPYIFYQKDGKVQVIIKNGDETDTIVLTRDELKKTEFRCATDSSSLPEFKFRPVPELTTNKSTYDMPSKLLAVSDIEGNFVSYYKLLVNNGVIDENYNWTFCKGHLVILGDLVDRGKNVTQCLWLTYKLEQEAGKHGGQVHYLLGNHEQFLLMGIDFYAHIKYKKLYNVLRISSDVLYSDSTELGRWMRTRNAMIKAGDIVFVHGGIHPIIGDTHLSVSEINKIVQDNIDTNEPDTDEAYHLLTGNGILWYRGFVEPHDDYEKITRQELTNLLKIYSCRKFVVGHTPVENVSVDMDNIIFRLDVDHYNNSQALLIEDNEYFMAGADGKRTKLLK
jgi:hypothetical protein